MWASRHTKQHGFTVVELLIVIVVIGILASLTLVSFFVTQRRSAEKEAEGDLRQAAMRLETHKANTGGYPMSQDDVDGGKGLPKSSDQRVFNYLRFGSGYCLSTTSNLSERSRSFVIKSQVSTTEVTEGECEDGIENPIISKVTVGGTGAKVDWSAVTGATSYEIQYRRNSGSWSTVTVPSGSTVTRNITGLVASSTYDFRMRSRSATVESEWTPAVRRVVVPTPVISSVANLGCGDIISTRFWLDVRVSWALGNTTYVTSFEVGPQSNHAGGERMIVPNSASGGALTLMRTTVTSDWYGMSNGSGSIVVIGIGPNGERSNPAIWTSPTYPPLYC